MASFHTKDVEEVIKELDTNIRGLSSSEVEKKEFKNMVIMN